MYKCRMVQGILEGWRYPLKCGLFEHTFTQNISNPEGDLGESSQP